MSRRHSRSVTVKGLRRLVKRPEEIFTFPVAGCVLLRRRLVKRPELNAATSQSFSNNRARAAGRAPSAYWG
jgi:hypothetical protein